MKIGYSVEGSTDRAFLNGLKERWCPQAELLEGRFRGKSGQSQRREIPKTCIELCSKGADFMIFMRDANLEDWRDVLKGDQAKCRPEHQHLTVFAVCDRNIECWLCADSAWIARRTGRPTTDFEVDDPKGVFESALEVSRRGRKEAEIADLVKDAPLHEWMREDSFRAFFDSLWQKSQKFGCRIENIRERPR